MKVFQNLSEDPLWCFGVLKDCPITSYESATFLSRVESSHPSMQCEAVRAPAAPSEWELREVHPPSGWASQSAIMIELAACLRECDQETSSPCCWSKFKRSWASGVTSLYSHVDTYTTRFVYNTQICLCSSVYVKLLMTINWLYISVTCQVNKEVNQTQENTMVPIQRLTFFIKIAHSLS